jgi:hypothetical protein
LGTTAKLCLKKGKKKKKGKEIGKKTIPPKVNNSNGHQ